MIWSPDGTAFVLIAKGGDVTVVQADGSGCEPLPIPGLIMKSLSITWSPDGQRIAYNDFTSNIPSPEFSELHVIDLNTYQTQKIYHKGGFPEWLPNGDRIILFGWKDAAPVIRADGSGLIGEIDVSEGYLLSRSEGIAWSPDGSRLALSLEKIRKSAQEPEVIGVLDLNELNLSVFQVSHFSEILAWTQDGAAVIIKTYNKDGRNVLKKIPIEH